MNESFFESDLFIESVKMVPSDLFTNRTESSQSNTTAHQTNVLSKGDDNTSIIWSEPSICKLILGLCNVSANCI